MPVEDEAQDAAAWAVHGRQAPSNLRPELLGLSRLRGPCVKALQGPAVQRQVLQAALGLMHGLGGGLPLDGLADAAHEN